LTSRNYERIGAQALVYGHTVIALSPTDFNLVKQLNILLYEMGAPKDRIIMDATSAALGYGHGILLFSYGAASDGGPGFG